MFVKIAEQLAVAVSGGEAKPQKAAALPFPPEASAAAPEIADGEAAPDADTETDQTPAPDANISAVTPAAGQQIGRASCRESVCQYVEISAVAVSFKKKKQKHTHSRRLTNYTTHRVHKHCQSTHSQTTARSNTQKP